MRKRARSRAGSGVPATRDRQRKPEAIFLLGFMGAGKSSVGPSLALQLGWAFEDLDERIERREQRRIHEIFRDSGESVFRAAERAALEELLSEVRAGARRVVALGGGAFVQNENARLIRDAGLATVFLDASVDELWRRCREQAAREGVERPLLSDLSEFRDLYENRRPHYARARFCHATDGKTVDEIVKELAEKIGMPSGKSSSIRLKATVPTQGTPKGRERGGKN